MGIGVVRRCGFDEHVDILRVFGGPGSWGTGGLEDHEHRALRHSRQLKLRKAWPELHEALMNGLGLDKFGNDREMGERAQKTYRGREEERVQEVVSEETDRANG